MLWKIVYIGLLLSLQSAFADTPVVINGLAINVNNTTERAIAESTDQRPDFRNITDSRQKKNAFFKYLLPQVRKANQAIEKERQLLLNFHDQLTRLDYLTPQQQQQLKAISQKYRHASPSIVNPEDPAWTTLLSRVDGIPASLVLAQAANESAWGTSRFAVDANNFFGIWCYSPGCGLKPRQRSQSATHEVKRYPSVGDGVGGYMLNLNTHKAYSSLRNLRMTQRNLRAPLKGFLLAEGLVAYSSRGIDYVRDIQRMIHTNKLEVFSRPYSV